MTKLSITNEDAIKLIREHYQLPESVEIEIGKQSTKKEERVWHSVPSNWKHNYPPEIALQYDMIEVIYRDGSRGYGTATEWEYAWCQDGCSRDIVKFSKAQ